VPAEKIHVVPFGANLAPVSRETVSESIAARNGKPCQLTFLGVDWLRKGLPFAYEVMRTLNKEGIRAELAVVGGDVPAISAKRWLKHYYSPLDMRYSPLEELKFQIQYRRDKRVKKIGFLNKDEPSEYSLLCEILKQTHFLLHPASFECFGIALAEANAFGVPVLAINNYGPRTVVRDGVNGYLFPPREYVERVPECIMRYMNDFKAYEALALSSFREYSVRLNWRSSWHKLRQLLAASLPDNPSNLRIAQS
jgi:glycosyltransferase involved in cell wall biosynthesis